MDARCRGVLLPVYSAGLKRGLFRNQLPPERRREAAEALRAGWAKLSQEELTPEIEQMIVEEVRAVPAEKRAA